MGSTATADLLRQTIEALTAVAEALAALKTTCEGQTGQVQADIAALKNAVEQLKAAVGQLAIPIEACKLARDQEATVERERFDRRVGLAKALFSNFYGKAVLALLLVIFGFLGLQWAGFDRATAARMISGILGAPAPIEAPAVDDEMDHAVP